MQGETTFHSDKRVIILFLVILFLIGLGVRMIGLDYGTPLLVHPDEENVVKSALRFTPKTGFDELAFNRPAQIIVALNAIVLRLYSQLRFHEPLYMVYYVHEFELYMVARLLTAVLGALIPLVTFFIGKQFKPDFSYPAALIFCFFPSYIKHSHFVSPDISITLWTLLIMLFSIRYAQGKGKGSLWLAVLFTSINTADKYPGIISSLMVLGALIVRFRAEAKITGQFDSKRFILKTLACLGAFFGFLFLVGPNLYLHFDSVLAALLHESSTVHLGADGLPYHLMLLVYLNYFVSNANWVLLGLVITGTIGLVRTKQRDGLFFLYGIIYCLLLNIVGKYYERWALPMYTSPLLAASFGTAWLIQTFKAKRPAVWALKSAFHVGLILLMLAGLAESLFLDLPDTRVVAQTYLDENGITAENSYFDGYTPFSPRDFPKDLGFDLAMPAKIEYAILSSLHHQRYFYNPGRSADQIKFYTQIRQDARLIKEFVPFNAPNTIRSQWLLLQQAIQLNLLNQEQPVYYSGPLLQVYQFTD